jgi:hypothetical protein
MNLQKTILANGFFPTPDKAIHGSLGNPASSQFQLEKWRSSPWGRYYYSTVNHPHAASWYPRDLAGSKQPRLHGDPIERDRESVCGCYQLPQPPSSDLTVKVPRATYRQVIITLQIGPKCATFNAAGFLLFHIIHKNYRNKSCIFFQDLFTISETWVYC